MAANIHMSSSETVKQTERGGNREKMKQREREAERGGTRAKITEKKKKTSQGQLFGLQLTRIAVIFQFLLGCSGRK